MRRAPRGFTLLELVTVTAINAIVVSAVVSAMINLDRTSRVRNLTANMQGQGREGLTHVEMDLRSASLGAGLGAVWAQVPASAAPQLRPTVQVFENLRGSPGGLLDVKPGTDAVLVVALQRREGAGRAALVGDHYDSMLPVAVSDTAGFLPGSPVLMGTYDVASWDVVRKVNAGAPGSLEFSSTTNLFPMKGILRILSSGSMVRPATSRLYFVSVNDELVRVELSVPRAPAVRAELIARDVIAQGVENLQVDCQVDDPNAGFAACPAPLAAADPIAAESIAALGGFGAMGGPRLDAAAAAGVRTIELSVVVRSRSELRQNGDPKIAIGDPPTVLPGGGAPDDAPTPLYVRRSYRMAVSVRNTSLQVM
jgi:prepilin-type N-terminal cleavage/methylation domain-containing protein